MTNNKIILFSLLMSSSLLGMEKENARREANLKFDLLLHKFGYKSGDWKKERKPFWYSVIQDKSIQLDKSFFEIYQERGGDLNVPTLHNFCNRRLLDLVIAEGRSYDSIKDLLECGVNPRLMNESENNCLHNLCSYPAYEQKLREGAQEDLVELLVRYGANINARNIYGWTPLDYALQESRTYLIKLLLKNGAECTQDICEINLKYALMCQKSHDAPRFIANFWHDYQRKHFLITTLCALKRIFVCPKDIRKKIISFLPSDCIPHYCLSQMYPSGQVKAILDNRCQVNMKLIQDLRPYYESQKNFPGQIFMKELKQEIDMRSASIRNNSAQSLVNSNIGTETVSNSGRTKKCLIQ